MSKTYRREKTIIDNEFNIIKKKQIKLNNSNKIKNNRRKTDYMIVYYDETTS